MANKKVQSQVKGKQYQKSKKKTNQTPLIAIGAVVLVLLVAAGAFLLKPGGDQVALAREISVDEAYDMREAGAFILDVRTPEEWNDFHIPGATLIPLDQLQNRVSEVPQDQDVVVVCRSGNRSATGRDILLGVGYENVTSMAGGVTQWQNVGYPTVSGP